MKKYLSILFLVAVFGSLSFVADKSSEKASLSAEEQKIMFMVSNLSAEEINTLSPSSLEAIIGRDLTWKETIALKKVRKMYSNQHPSDGSKSKSQGIAFLLVLLLGIVGVHRFYLGYIGIGIVQILTIAGCGIWALIDMIRIVTGTLNAADGSQLTHWFDKEDS